MKDMRYKVGAPVAAEAPVAEGSWPFEPCRVA